MNIKTVQFMEETGMFRCPICREALYNQSDSLICTNGHTFNFSKKGSVNFVPSQKPLKYTRELFDARGRIFEQGFYEPVVQKIGGLLNQYDSTRSIQSGKLRIVDAGCGQGYYTKILARNSGWTVTGFDLSPDAIRQASSGVHSALFMVADVTNIPLKDRSQDVILDILTQANYQEFRRVLKPSGLVIKVMPGEFYLAEIRELLTGQLRQEAYSDEPVIEHFNANHINTNVTSLRYQLPLTRSQAEDFLLMTPMALSADRSLLDAGSLTSITIHLNILTGQYAN